MFAGTVTVRAADSEFRMGSGLRGRRGGDGCAVVAAGVAHAEDQRDQGGCHEDSHPAAVPAAVT
ncbi:hypothetical protein [Streptomyces sp. CG 926]|uniref:hypothetical protein n=1 Tax=Streptomyces sp. CG 926 TaxID=1882405 RepID=UPI0011B3854D|nr:hypothetical protein [Streptomyces sp. CG 926]